MNVISISLGSSKRDKKVTVEWGGQLITIERRGTDGDTRRAVDLFTTLDGKIDVFGVGGISLDIHIGEKRYPLRAAHKLVAGVHHTPVVDGSGLKQIIERQVVKELVEALGPAYNSGRVLITAAVDRYDMALSFVERGYDVVYGDLMFGLGIPLPIRKFSQFKALVRLLLPFVCWLPIRMLYPTGDKQEHIVPKYTKWYDWATVIAGDCHYIKRHMPDDLSGKVIVTNTTTEADFALFKARGVKAILTTTPVLEGRSFGTNAIEAAVTALVGKNRPLTPATGARPEMIEMVDSLNLKPTIHSLSD